MLISVKAIRHFCPIDGYKYVLIVQKLHLLETTVNEIKSNAEISSAHEVDYTKKYAYLQFYAKLSYDGFLMGLLEYKRSTYFFA